MRHFRIKEIIIGESKEYTIQYTKWFLFIKYWRKYNKLPFKRYEDALLEVKKVINLEKDYTKVKKNKIIRYHYIDAFKMDVLNASKNVRNVQKVATLNNETTNRYNKSVFIPKNVEK